MFSRLNLSPVRLFLLVGALVLAVSALAPGRLNAAGAKHEDDGFPLPLGSYHEEPGQSVWEVIAGRAQENPFNIVATALFFCAIVHTFCAGFFKRWAHRHHHKHEERQLRLEAEAHAAGRPFQRARVSLKTELIHFLGEVEAIFGIWVIPLILAISITYGFTVAEEYVSFDVGFTEPMFVVVIMTIAATRPVMKLAEQAMGKVAELFGGTPAAWWFSVLTLGPILGSLITEPAAMTISALLLASRFYEHNPSTKLMYATIGLLFVNVSVGGTLTHFAAPPVLMVSGAWHWGTDFMLVHFGWKAVVGILVSNTLYAVYFRRELAAMRKRPAVEPEPESRLEDDPWKKHKWPVPKWVTVVHLFFLGWTVLTNHYPALFIGGFLVFLAFVNATVHHQEDIRLKPALLVGFFLAGLVIHGGLQQWWIGPVLGALSELPLMLGATVLTAFNDNAAVTYLASLVPGLTPETKYAVVVGAVTGGGLTVIANAPNPAGQSILQKFFTGGVSPAYLFLGAALPTVILGVLFMLLPF